MVDGVMPFRETVVRGSDAHDHIVQFFDTLDSLGATVGDFARAGLAANEAVLIVARGEAWRKIAGCLTARGEDVDGAVRRGELVVRDAAALLSQFTRIGWPDRARFEAVVGRLVGELARRGKLRVYGEIVDVLAADGDFGAAVELERLWNDLARRETFSLFCGYSALHFGPQGNSEALKLICRCHSAARADVEDDLATWLLDPPGAGGSRPSTRSPYRSRSFRLS
jgi:hypothetical protein